MPLFGKSSKSPSDAVRNLKDAFITLEKGGQDAKKQEKVRKCGIVVITRVIMDISKVSKCYLFKFRHKKIFQSSCLI